MVRVEPSVITLITETIAALNSPNHRRSLTLGSTTIEGLGGDIESPQS